MFFLLSSINIYCQDNIYSIYINADKKDKIDLKKLIINQKIKVTISLIEIFFKWKSSKITCRA